MKYTRFILAALLAAAVLPGYARDKVGVVMMVDLVHFHPNNARDRKLMADTEKDYQSKLDKRRQRFDELRQEFDSLVKETRNPALNEKARLEAEEKAAKHRAVLADVESDLRRDLKKYQGDLADLESRLLRQVTSEIRDIVTQYAKDNSYRMIYDGTTLPYFDPDLDITDEILKKMGVDPKVRKEAKARADAEDKAASDAYNSDPALNPTAVTDPALNPALKSKGATKK